MNEQRTPVIVPLSFPRLVNALYATASPLGKRLIRDAVGEFNKRMAAINGSAKDQP
ncbi:hypothetical protein IMZ11_02500 [Microtetraspora sp. AC03309]|uniref:hypothetical protein n=1 Tax=Microtetraspora sp. AC03309 TaxID=2779376 RepID=UPI001E536983|nr:hypothetical protein [Microtetraspora sp. AC03309]MCC5574509.1 hypothetical protein [Microtetraspora sp. AC03309]